MTFLLTLLYLTVGLVAGRVFYRHNHELSNGNNDDRSFLQCVTWVSFFLWPVTLVIGAGFGVWWLMTNRPEQALPFRSRQRELLSKEESGE